MSFRIGVYEFLAFPAHIWLTVVAWICGGQFSCGVVEDEDEELPG